MDYKEYFRQCNEDRRETERKRDQLIAFYTVIVGAYFAFAKDLAPDSSPPELIQLRDAFTLVIAMLGLILAAALIKIRQWHVVYLNTSKLLQYLAHHEVHTLRKLIEDPDRGQTDKQRPNVAGRLAPKFTYKTYPSGVVFLTYNAYLVVSFLPVYTAFKVLGCPTLFAFRQLVHEFAIYLVVFIFVMNALAFLYLRRSLARTPWANWLLEGLLDGKGILKPPDALLTELPEN